MMAFGKSVTCIFLFTLLFTNTDAQGHDLCLYTKNCSCLLKVPGWSLDLLPIGGHKFGPEKMGDYYYTYWPCVNKWFGGASCSAYGSVIQASSVDNPDQCYSCGDAEQQEFGYDADGMMYIQYNSSQNNRTSRVRFICSPNDDPGTLRALGEVALKLYAFELTSKFVCPIPPGTRLNPPSSNNTITENV